MTPPGTFERVYAALKEKLRQGVLRPGDRLEPALLSDELFASVTPIRDALHRLTGERLIEAPRQEGFRVPLLTESRLRHLYAWHRDLLLLAIMRRRALVADPERLGRPLMSGHEQRRAMFLAIARSTGNPEHSLALEAVSERLEPLEELEDMLLDAVEAETQAISEAIAADDPKLLRKRLLSYHRRRERIVPELLARIQRPS
jgi:DNA-binding FadR family transcriptional regulator